MNVQKIKEVINQREGKDILIQRDILDFLIERAEISEKYETALKQIKTSYNSEDAKNIAYMTLYSEGIE